jgi:ribosomal protein S18 acetylase RimI-like enzyme
MEKYNMIIYTNSTDGISPDNLNGFFVGWPKPPSPSTHLNILKQSSEFVLAVDDDSGNVVGFITAITDGILSAYMPLLEVLPEYQRRGIGQELVRRMLRRLKNYYMIDLTCDKELQGFYEKLGLKPGLCMMIRNFDHQSGKK